MNNPIPQPQTQTLDGIRPALAAAFAWALASLATVVATALVAGLVVQFSPLVCG